MEPQGFIQIQMDLATFNTLMKGIQDLLTLVKRVEGLEDRNEQKNERLDDLEYRQELMEEWMRHINRETLDANCGCTEYQGDVCSKADYNDRRDIW